jgi:hypothetical protein
MGFRDGIRVSEEREGAMHLRFQLEKSLQAAGCLLELHGDCMEYVRLLKLLYIADREMVAEAGAPITGDRAVAMDHGPGDTHRTWNARRTQSVMQ